MSSDEDLDLLMDAVSEHMDIASQAGVPADEVVDVVMLASARFLIDKMPVEQVLIVLRKACDDLQLRMPQMKENPEVKH
ncbi:MAG: hypothetical protein EOR34_10470 [Mesorhizobium sp.]|uniref:hypothetical protein n=1 Tax=Mesorhizobium sp. TaxID=1871066 RepID=UPI000FE85A2D|nr:hypothetical protein [Mesorhizobium sp.]RWH49630.1 MAG: hypothetical protein EOQ80_06900 [Mesorhizobium sp.]RWI48436.1 MAG: hypothetical protein EOR15_13820 [Mesorhizobium sp.]RWI88187.1 MAG: hypothetical protein EOR20_03875 [Mesorhizobium sp.]RWJ60055.1 MAG: hypothetical protein EOR32_19390 [Mesorhizobium sp.]RWJ74305.1 MAG: hypothetical protein EOR34_10470 [Mesorhizobium sp.]